MLPTVATLLFSTQTGCSQLSNEFRMDEDSCRVGLVEQRVNLNNSIGPKPVIAVKPRVSVNGSLRPRIQLQKLIALPGEKVFRSTVSCSTQTEPEPKITASGSIPPPPPLPPLSLSLPFKRTTKIASELNQKVEIEMIDSKKNTPNNTLSKISSLKRTDSIQVPVTQGDIQNRLSTLRRTKSKAKDTYNETLANAVNNNTDDTSISEKGPINNVHVIDTEIKAPVDEIVDRRSTLRRTKPNVKDTYSETLANAVNNNMNGTLQGVETGNTINDVSVSHKNTDTEKEVSVKGETMDWRSILKKTEHNLY